MKSFNGNLKPKVQTLWNPKFKHFETQLSNTLKPNFQTLKIGAEMRNWNLGFKVFESWVSKCLKAGFQTVSIIKFVSLNPKTSSNFKKPQMTVWLN